MCLQMSTLHAYLPGKYGKQALHALHVNNLHVCFEEARWELECVRRDEGKEMGHLYHNNAVNDLRVQCVDGTLWYSRHNIYLNVKPYRDMLLQQPPIECLELTYRTDVVKHVFRAMDHQTTGMIDNQDAVDAYELCQQWQYASGANHFGDYMVTHSKHDFRVMEAFATYNDPRLATLYYQYVRASKAVPADLAWPASLSPKLAHVLLTVASKLNLRCKFDLDTVKWALSHVAVFNPEVLKDVETNKRAIREVCGGLDSSSDDGSDVEHVYDDDDGALYA